MVDVISAHLLKKTEWWGAGMVICLERGADLHMAQHSIEHLRLLIQL